MHIVLLAIQISLLPVMGVVLWQIRKKLPTGDLPEDAVPDRKRTDFLTKRLDLLSICFVAEAVLSVLQLILRFLDTL